MGKTNDYTAIGPLTGFIYQIYYFLYRLLTMLDGETVSLEKIDDVGTEEGGRQTYFQLKHSINSKPSDIKRMANRDPDLWKTLNMWVNIIKKKGDEKAQRQWIEKSEFVLTDGKGKKLTKAEILKNGGGVLELLKPDGTESLVDQGNIETFGLKGLYRMHSDYVKDIVEKVAAYDVNVQNALVGAFQGTARLPQNVHDFVWGKYLEEAEYERRPLSKLTKEILEQMGIKR